jgi:hypothetical protein
MKSGAEPLIAVDNATGRIAGLFLPVSASLPVPCPCLSPLTRFQRTNQGAPGMEKRHEEH